jgi:exopolyphosphatase / guanosine-5'-triphosphate,3'-diphosphate pyrophosphatase
LLEHISDLKVSVVDLGFNSAKLVNYHVNTNNKSFKAYQREGEKVRLGEDLLPSGILGTESIQRTITTLKLFRDIINTQCIKHVLSIATSAVREAKNQNDFLEEVLQKTGFRFRVLSGRDEALYSYLGALQSTCVPSTLFFDLGGGSLELVYTENFKIKKFISLPLGALRLTQSFSGSGGYGKKDYARMEQHITNKLPNRKILDINPDTTLVGVGGTLRAMARYDQEIRKYPLDKIHNYRIGLDHVQSITDTLRKMTSYEIAKIDAVGSNRAETITAGSCIVNILVRKLRFENILVSANGLREGILSSFLQSCKRYYSHNINQTQIQRYVKHCCKPEKISEYSYTLVRPLYASGLIKQREYEIFAHAVKQISILPHTINLHNLFYMIIDEDNPRLSHREQTILAISIIRTKKAKTANLLFSRYRSLMQPQNRKSIEKIAACLSLSEILEWTKSKVKFVKCNQNEIVFTFIRVNNNPLPISLIESALKNFKEAFDIPVNYSIPLVYNRALDGLPVVGE